MEVQEYSADDFEHVILASADSEGDRWIARERAGWFKRASYGFAIAWIAEHDSAADSDILDPVAVSELITAQLVADLFDVPVEKVGRDIVRYREKHGI